MKGTAGEARPPALLTNGDGVSYTEHAGRFPVNTQPCPSSYGPAGTPSTAALGNAPQGQRVGLTARLCPRPGTISPAYDKVSSYVVQKACGEWKAS